MNSNDNKSLGLHKKNMSFNPENNGFMSVRPKSTKQIAHTKNNSNVINYNIGVNKGTSNVNITIKKKEISVNKNSNPSN